MPGLDGFETAAMIRERERSRVTPIIFLTAAYKSETQMFKGYEMGAVDYLLKPIVSEVLRSKVSVFVELAIKSELVKQQAIQLERKNNALKDAKEKGILLEKLKLAINARDQFLSIASHELRTPLTSLKLYVQIILRKFNLLPSKDPNLQDFANRLHGIDDQIEQMTKLVNDLLDVSRISNHQLEIVLDEVDLNSIVQRVVERFSDELKKAGCVLHLQMDPDIIGLWDPMRLEQVVTNLLSNAIKYGQGKPIELTVQANTTHATLKIKDHGIGIAPENQKRIFNRFERAVSTHHYGGLGLGLWIAKQIIESLEGTIQVESQIGSGATFSVSLPGLLKEKRITSSTIEKHATNGFS
jgi:signal transduction histidine kinase